MKQTGVSKAPMVYVLLQFSIIFAIAWYAGVWGGLEQNIVMFVGIFLGIWAIVTMRLRVSVFPDVRSDQRLYTGGPYRYIRHPMYTAVLVTVLAWASNRPDEISVSLWVVLCVDLLLKLQYEEQRLLGRFDDYAAYMLRTKRLIPFVY